VTALLEARELTAGYGGMPAIRDVSLRVEPGEVVAILGPNGAGKTTTLLTLSGALKQMSGEVVFDGKPVKSKLHKRAKQGLSLVTEERSVFMGLTTNANLRLGRGAPSDAIEKFPELKPLLRRRAGLLSGGEQQILTLARALASKPRILLADELSLGLAPLIVQRLLRAVREAADRGIGVIVVEQHARQALSMADRAYVLRRGCIELSGRASELLEQLDEVERSYLSGPTTS